MTAAECLRQYNFDLKNIRTYFFDFTIFLACLLFRGKVWLIYGLLATTMQCVIHSSRSASGSIGAIAPGAVRRWRKLLVFHLVDSFSFPPSSRCMSLCGAVRSCVRMALRAHSKT